MAKENQSSYSVSKETALLLDGVKCLDQAWDCVYESLRSKHPKADDDKISGLMKQFDEAQNAVKEIVMGMIKENLYDHISTTNFKEV